SVSKVSLVNASVSGTVTFKESVEMDVYGFGSNISSFEVEGQVSVTVNMTESAYSETNIQVEGITFTQNISDDQVYAQTDEYGPAGGDKTYTSATFPSAAMQYVSKLVNGYVSGTPSFPMPSLTDSETAKTKYEYRMMTAADMADELSAMQEMMTFDFRSLAVLIPSDRNFNESNYKSALESAGFKYNEDEEAYICSNMSDLENMYNSDTMSDNPYEAINALNSITNKKFYRLQVNISTDERYCNISFTSVIMEYNFEFSDLIYGDYTD
ncbi:MAG: hypothetical protein J6W76_08625, partial [Spirochaetales bacterium]|nr:hypothetical protein [Spirochaetales bacterium]